MSPIRSGGAKVGGFSSEELGLRTAALESALGTGGDELDYAHVGRARAVVDKVRERTSLSGDHTVVALAGATGSGKSSLFNTLVGADVARIGARRPTTSKPTAAVWGTGDAGELLDWLKVDARHVVPDGQHDRVVGSLDGLVLLDLPDFDSREASHRLEAERILELVDVFVWVTDPQKYADARLHDDFVQLLAQHESVTLAVLNQADRLPPDAVDACVADLRSLLSRDGIADATVLPTSVRTGAGIAELRQRIANSVAGRTASRQRLSADVVTIARILRKDVADDEVRADRLPRRDLDAALARAAGVPIVLDAVGRQYRRDALAHSGWIFTRWIGRRGADPMRRLRLDGSGGRQSKPVERGEADVRTSLGRSSIPAPSDATRSAVEVATRAFVQSASQGLPVRWGRAVDDAAEAGDETLADALDQAVLGTSLAARRPGWWFAANALQWLFGVVAVLGALWLLLLYVLSLLAIPPPETPLVGVVPVPTLMLIAGVLLGVLFALLARWLALIGARRRSSRIEGRLRKAIAAVTDERIVAPISAVLARHRTTREQLDRAGR
ncbi:GTPase [Lysobacter korlensis]|uniref:GTPase n=1 Tax=Lysobacter korlensis TaxID=553636 RepID=A0ABV6RXH0_9GAMM